jgi:hypothetical protein
MAGSEACAANHRPGDLSGAQNRYGPSPNIPENFFQPCLPCLPAGTATGSAVFRATQKVEFIGFSSPDSQIILRELIITFC